MNQISTEAKDVLNEIIDHENDGAYWQKRFNGLSRKDDSILRGCFKELSDNGLVSTRWGSNYPYHIAVLKDGYLYEQHLNEAELIEKKSLKTSFENELEALLERARTLSTSDGTKGTSESGPAMKWMNDVQIFYDANLKDHVLGGRISSILFHRAAGAFEELVACLESISDDTSFIEKKMSIDEKSSQATQIKAVSEYDVFLSHANKDKPVIVDDLNESLKTLGIKIFYDKDSLEWGDNWKQKIIEGTGKAEFAIIVISEHFFGREWTERELNEFLNRQNSNNQKLILPILHGITNEQLKQKYPRVADIQAIDSAMYTSDQIALLFARQLIQRLKNN